MDHHQRLLARLAQPSGGRIVLLVLDGVGDLRTLDQPHTALEAARIPHLDALAGRSALGRITPVAPGITPGSGPGHLALFGYDPSQPEADIGRGVLEALGLGLKIGPGDVAARGNFATRDGQGNLTDRRAGRPSTEVCRRICAHLQDSLDADPPEGLQVQVEAGEGHRFVLVLRGEGLSPDLADTDPQKTGVPVLPLSPRRGVEGEQELAARSTIERLEPAMATLRRALEAEPAVNELLLRGFSGRPALPQWDELYRLRGGAFAGYPLYRGVAAACGMEVVPCGKGFADLVTTAAARKQDFDFLFLHVKQTDAAGEDGNLDAKVAVLEEVDAGLPDLLGLLDPARDVLAITGDHSTPAPMKAHSWHPVPLLVNGPYCYLDDTTAFTEEQALQGHLGTFPARELMGLLLANAGRLKKFGA
jgi:2,3-bisphosphoglycerate-independent phosphoglycerate mutase